MSYQFPPAHPHGELEEIFDNIFFVTGTVAMNGLMRFSRNMTVVRDGSSLTIVNSLRLDEKGLAKLDALGRVEHVLRICGFHGMDDPFYKDRYGARVWAIEGMKYAKGFDYGKPDLQTYFEPDATMTAGTELPVAGAKLLVFETSKPPEGIVHLDREGGILLSGDSMQNWAGPDAFFSFMAKIAMRLMGFFKPCNIGPGWLKGARPTPADVRRVLDLRFEHVIPVHGGLVEGGAKERFRPAFERLR
jgi:hypothetical protein